MTRSASSPTAAASGLPPKVEPCEPGVKTFMTSRRATKADTGSTPPPSALPTMMPSGRTFSCSNANHAPVRPRPDCTSSTMSSTRWWSHSARTLDRGEITERHRAEASRERPEAVAIGSLRGKTHNGGGAAVEIALRHDDLGAVAAHALDPIGPAARGLDRGLDRLGAGVHRQRRIEAADAAEFVEER